jgi:DNA-binding response OmpR family regulator
VLVVEDNLEMANLIRIHLQDLPCEVDLAADGIVGLEKARSGAYDLIILDLMLPGMDGLEVCRRLRSGEGYPPILMLTARSGELDRVLGLEMGADDYLTKPFSFLELAARVKAFFRRAHALAAARELPEAQEIRIGALAMDLGRREVQVNNRPVELTAKEFDLLFHFARNPGRTYTRLQLLDAVWGYHYEGYEHAVNCLINRLRAKIEENQASPKYILTVRGVGYKFAEAPDQRAA